MCKNKKLNKTHLFMNGRPDEVKIKNKKFKKYDDNYYISKSGDIYSVRNDIFLKHGIDIDGYHRVDLYGKHKKVHKLVYETWIGKVPKKKQINHIDDDKDNNHINNLYIGTQKDNIRDEFKNRKRVGYIYMLMLINKETSELLVFCPLSTIKDHFEFKGMSFSKLKRKEWFFDKYEILEYKKIRSRKELESVTTMCDECNTVG